MTDRFAAWRFDGRTAEAREATLHLEGNELVVGSAGGGARFPLDLLRISEPFDRTPRMVELPNGETLQVIDGTRFSQAIEAAGISASPVVRLQRHGPAVAGVLAMLIASLAYAYFVGVPAAARWLARHTPPAAEQSIGAQVLDVLDESFLSPTRLDAAVRDSIASRFARAAELAAPGEGTRIEFRRYRHDPEPGEDGPAMINALSLPGGTIVVLDGLVGAAEPDPVFAVLGHELGHVVHHHAMQGLYRSAGVAALAALAWGDFSGVAASVPTVLGLLRYDRELETEADAFAVRFLATEQLGPEPLCGFFRIVQEIEGEAGIDAFPEFLSTHPSTAERIATLCPE